MAFFNDNESNGERLKTGANPSESPQTITEILDKRESLSESRKTRSDKGKRRVKSEAINTTPVQGLFTPESTQPLIEIPFATCNVLFKTSSFSLDAVETTELSHSGANVLNQFAPDWNPKWVALSAFSLGFSVLMLKKFMIYQAEQKKKRETQESATYTKEQKEPSTKE
jgi:hypothetical protein